MRHRVLAFSLIACMGAGQAVAETRAVTAKAEVGRPTRIAMHADVGPNCTLGPAPRVDITTKPRFGTVSVRPARVMSKTGACAGKEIAVQDIVYKARAGGGGRTDRIVYQVVDGKNERKVDMKIAIAPAQGSAQAR